MKINFNTNRAVNIFIIAVAALICVLLYFKSFNVTHTPIPFIKDHNETYTAEQVLEPFDPNISTDLPHNKYLNLTRLAKVKRALKNGEWLTGTGASFGWVMGTTNGWFCDTCTITPERFNEQGKQQFYLKLPGWKLNPQPNGYTNLAPSEFHVEHGQSYVRKFISSKVLQKSNGKHYTVHQVDEPVKFRYDSQSDCMMIPVTVSIKEFCTVMLLVFICTLITYFLYLIATFLKFIIDVSRGLSFTTNNVKRLRLIAYSLLGLPVLMLLLTLCTRLIFNSYFTSDIVLNSGAWSNSLQELCAGIVFLLLFKAFKQGKALKEELDLTV